MEWIGTADVVDPIGTSAGLIREFSSFVVARRSESARRSCTCTDLHLSLSIARTTWTSFSRSITSFSATMCMRPGRRSCGHTYRVSLCLGVRPMRIRAPCSRSADELRRWFQSRPISIRTATDHLDLREEEEGRRRRKTHELITSSPRHCEARARKLHDAQALTANKDNRIILDVSWATSDNRPATVISSRTFRVLKRYVKSCRHGAPRPNIGERWRARVRRTTMPGGCSLRSAVYRCEAVSLDPL